MGKYKVLVDNYTDGNKDKIVSLEDNELTDALIAAGVVEPAKAKE